MKFTFQVWDAANLDDRQAWIDLWAAWPEREVFAHPDYVRLYCGEDCRAMCAVASSSQSHILYPFLLRTIGCQPYSDGALRDCTDIVTPYGYGGPYRCGAPSSSGMIEAFWTAFDAWAARSNAVSEFVRFSLFSDALVPYPGACRSPGQNVVRILKSPEEVWQDFEYKVRKNVKRAAASGVAVQIDETGDRLDDFLNVYSGTMIRRNAQRSYFFPRDYFETIGDTLKGQYTYFHAVANGTVVSTELVLVSATRVYSFLGGTDARWFHARPNDLLKVEIMNWARGAGKTEFVLGGGYARDDGIYRYKLSFAPGGSVPFSVGSRILNAHTYQALVNSRRQTVEAGGEEWQPNPEFFPAYRA